MGDFCVHIVNENRIILFAKAPSTSGSSSVTTPDNGNKPSSGGSTSGSGSKPSGGSSSSGDNEIEG